MDLRRDGTVRAKLGERKGQPTAGVGCDAVRRLRVEDSGVMRKVKSPRGWLRRLVRPWGCLRMDARVVMVLLVMIPMLS
jgi:hypothetical protein